MHLLNRQYRDTFLVVTYYPAITAELPHLVISPLLMALQLISQGVYHIISPAAGQLCKQAC